LLGFYHNNLYISYFFQNTMAEARGYSIWMMPSEQVYDELSGLIMKLSGEYGTPKFEPHVTLLRGIESLEEDVSHRTSELAKLIKPFKIELEGLDQFDDPFRCLFIKAKETPELTDANLKARNVFSGGMGAIYMPHLSLIYGNLSKDMKETIILNLKKEKEGKEPAYGFDVDKLYLFSTQGGPDKWYKSGEFPLTG